MKEMVLYMDAKEEGIEEGIEKERQNTEAERKRADEAESRAAAAEAELAKYREKFGGLAQSCGNPRNGSYNGRDRRGTKSVKNRHPGFNTRCLFHCSFNYSVAEGLCLRCQSKAYQPCGKGSQSPFPSESHKIKPSLWLQS